VAEVSYDLREAEEVRETYEAALRPRRFADPDAIHVVMGVYTDDLAEGRGDVYVAVGLGRRLVELGYEVVYLHRDDWYDLPEGTDLFLSMLAEPTVKLDLLRLDPSMTRVAWARNNTERWIGDPQLPLYDAVLCSSPHALREIGRHYPGPTGILPIGVDPDLFSLERPEGGGDDDGGDRDRTDRRGAVSTVNQWPGPRRQLFAALAETGVGQIDLALFGNHHDLPDELAAHTAGSASYFSLPSLYRQAKVVLDDQQDVNRGYGGVNSRIYESLACGALPITNTTLGLADVGLEATPSYTTAEQLGAQLRELLGDGPRRDELVARLRSTVLEEHTYPRRARSLDRFLDEHGLKAPVGRHGAGSGTGAAGSGGAGPDEESGGDGVGRVSPTDFPVVGFLADYTVTNPYQGLLHSRLVHHGAAAAPVPAFDRVGDVSRALGSRLVLHVHWTDPLLGPAADPTDERARLRDFLRALDGHQRRGGALIWTVHNLLPHDRDDYTLEVELRQELADRADAVHVMCERTVELAAQHYRIPEEVVRVIPHASYVDVYPHLIGREHAREELGIAQDADVVLFFGQIRPYKGVEELLDAVDEVRPDHPDLRLLVAGQPGKDARIQPTVERLRDSDQVTAILDVVPDEDLQVLMSAADIVALPYRSALNSGTLHLALTYGRPVVAADVGCLPSGLTERTGVTFAPRAGGLAGALRTALRRFTRDREATTRACAEAARSYTYLDMAEDYARLVDEVTGGGDRGDR
jgi:glycosyltransferase involved in cell wall biosynthesis